MEPNSKKFAEFLRAARERKALTLRAVEKATGISNAYLSQLEGGKIQQPSPVMLNKLSALYQVSYADILELAGYPVPDRSNNATSYSRLASRMGPTTKDEEDALLEYLEFLRSRRKRGQRR